MEGPSIHLLANQLQDFIGQKVTKVSGNAKFEKENLKNQIIQDIYAFGKRLIIQFEQDVLAIHFLMYGSYRIGKPRAKMPIRLAIITKKHGLYLYNCSIKHAAIKNLKKRLPLDMDILANNWNRDKVIAAMKKNAKARIDDILLNQKIFPGIGNIIKNEALFLSKTSPNKKISQLSKKQLEKIVQNAREFSQRFLQLRAEFQLKKNLKIYRKKNCPICNGPIKRQKTGLTNRWSFWCPNCQR